MRNQTKVLVKVGVNSDINFSHTKAFRAITLDELKYCIDNTKDLHILVIEHILDSEEDQIVSIIEHFKSLDESNRVFFYVKDNDETTCGVADELGFDIYLTLNELHRIIYDTMGINVSTDIDFRKEIMEKEIANDDFIGTMDFVPEKPLDVDKVISDIKTDVSEKEQEQDESPVKVNETDTEKNHKVSLTKNDYKPDLIEESTSTSIDKQADSDIYIPDERVLELEEKIEKLIKALHTIEAERDAITNAYKNLVESGDFIEEPIGASEYLELQQDKERVEHEVLELKQSIDEYEKDINRLKEKAEEKDSLIDSLRDELSEIRIGYDTLKDKVESGELNAEQIKEYKNKIAKLEANMAPLSNDLKNAYNNIQELMDDISRKDVQIEFEVDSRLKIMTILHSVALNYKKSFDEIKELKTKIDRLQSECNKVKTQSNKKDETIAEQSKRIMELKVIEDSVDTKIRLAVEEERNKLELMTIEKERLESEVKMANEQLSLKDDQYRELMRNGAAGLDGNSLAKINETLKKSIKDYQEKFMALQKEHRELKTKSEVAINNYRALEEQNASLQNILNSSIGAGGSGGKLVLPKINYTGKANIYAVFGRGSLGVSMTAVSLVNKMPGNTLFIDLDLVTPKADVWFGKDPKVNVPGYMGNIDTTAMSLFFDRGLDFLKQYYRSIVFEKVKTKSGSIHCLFGAYNRPSSGAVAKSDIQGLFNFLGNIYDNIVVDLGKINCSDASDQLIKVISDISVSTLFVSSSDKFDINQSSVWLRKTGIMADKLIWLLNMVEDTTARKAIGKIKVYQIPFDRALWGKKLTFFNGAMTRGRFNVVLEALGVINN